MVAARLVTRADDTEAVMSQRLKTYHSHCDAIKANYTMVQAVIDGNQAKDKVYAQVHAALNKLQ